MNASLEVTGKIVELLSQIGSEERLRIVHAALALLGETRSAPNDGAAAYTDGSEGSQSLPPRAKLWMKQNGISFAQLSQVVHLADGKVELIAASPGKDMKQRVLNTYVLVGLVKFLGSGEPTFDDKTAREFCKSAGCYDTTNHAKYVKDKGNEFVGSKEKGWTLTSPGLKRAVELVLELAK